jgi:hypothetical protein
VTPGPEKIAKEFHETYERLAPEFNYETRLKSRVPWEDIPKENRELMIAVVEDLIVRRVILTIP